MRIGLRILKRLSHWKWRLVLVYLCLLVISDIKRWRTPVAAPAPDLAVVSLPAIKDDKPAATKIRLAYKEFRPANNPNAAVVVLLQGSPGSHRDFNKLGPILATNYRVIAPDLLGFGASSHAIPDYSNRAHARYVLALLDQLQVSQA